MSDHQGSRPELLVHRVHCNVARCRPSVPCTNCAPVPPESRVFQQQHLSVDRRDLQRPACKQTVDVEKLMAHECDCWSAEHQHKLLQVFATQYCTQKIQPRNWPASVKSPSSSASFRTSAAKSRSSRSNMLQTEAKPFRRILCETKLHQGVGTGTLSPFPHRGFSDSTDNLETANPTFGGNSPDCHPFATWEHLLRDSLYSTVVVLDETSGRVCVTILGHVVQHQYWWFVVRRFCSLRWFRGSLSSPRHFCWSRGCRTENSGRRVRSWSLSQGIYPRLDLLIRPETWITQHNRSTTKFWAKFRANTHSTAKCCQRRKQICSDSIQLKHEECVLRPGQLLSTSFWCNFSKQLAFHGIRRCFLVSFPLKFFQIRKIAFACFFIFPHWDWFRWLAVVV